MVSPWGGDGCAGMRPAIRRFCRHRVACSPPLPPAKRGVVCGIKHRANGNLSLFQWNGGGVGGAVAAEKARFFGFWELLTAS